MKVLKRTAINKLNEWYLDPKRKPLVLRGARQVGKSTLVRSFCHQHKLNLVEINLEKKKIKSFLNEDNFSIEEVLSEIEIQLDTLIEPNSLIFIDEIQAMPIAINRLRYFYEDRPDLKIIAAGSLLEVVLNKENFSIPVGRIEYHHLFPMTFFEFLDALDEKVISKQLQDNHFTRYPNQSLHNKCISLLKIYYFVGGMPEAVNTYVETKDLTKVRNIQQNLITTFEEDIPKYARGSKYEKVSSVYQNIPIQYGNPKITFSHLANGNSITIREAIDLLHQARVINKITHSNCSGLPLKSNSDSSTMKCFFLDVGLYNALIGTSYNSILNLSETLLVKGKMAEHFVAQHLLTVTNSNELFYWLRDKKKGASEVDFVISFDGTIYPIEVKSGATGKMRSLWQYVYEKKSKVAIRIDLKYRDEFINKIEHKIMTKDDVHKIECELLTVPLYMIEQLNEAINALKD